MAALPQTLAAIDREYERRSWRRNFEARLPPVFRPLLRPSRYKAIKGGRGAAKSHSVAELLIARCHERLGTRLVCIRQFQTSLDESVKRLLEDKIAALGLGEEFEVQARSIKTPGNGLIIFAGMQDHTADSLKSLEGFDYAWVEEAHSLSQNSLDILRPTLRKSNSELWFTWNPRFATDPVDAFFNTDGEKPPDTIFVEASFKDNPHLSDKMHEELEYDKRRDPDKYAHIWLGQYQRNSEARVFKNWKIEAFGPPAPGTPFLLGGDWGFAQDPTASSLNWVDHELKRLYVYQEVWEIGCEIDATPALLDRLGCAEVLAGRPCGFVRCERCEKRIVPDCPACIQCKAPGHGLARLFEMTADSARPETISYLQRHGYPKLKAAKKGPNSVEEGIKFLQNYDIIIHPRCVKTADEFTMYSYKVDPHTKAILPFLVDKKNHVIDQLRYAVEDLRAVENELSAGVLW